MAWMVGAAGLDCQSQQQQQQQQQSLAARANGCQRPWAVLQLISWALLPALALDFFALMTPLCTTRSSRVALEAVYGVLLVTTAGLALATTIIDPADPRVKNQQQQAKAKGATAAAAAAKTDTDADGEDKMEAEDELEEESMHHRRAFNSTDPSATSVYCYLCKTDVAETSAHCRHCRKCCDRFDHHCAWLNTCIGRPNYACFVSTVAAALALLGVQTAAATVLLARYVLQREAFVNHAAAALPSLPPAACLGLLILSLTATAPLLLLVGQLLLFHAVLRLQGFTTYEYVLRETRRRAARAEAAAARRLQRQQLFKTAGQALRNQEEQQSPAPPRIVELSAVAAPSSTTKRPPSSLSSSWWVRWGPWGGKGKQGTQQQQQGGKGLPGDEFLVAHKPDEEEEGLDVGVEGGLSPTV